MATESSPAVEKRVWYLFGAVAAMFAAGLVGYAVNWGPVEATDWGVGGHAQDILFRIGMFLFPVTGSLIARRQPKNAVGWLLLAVGLGWALYWLCLEYARYAIDTSPGALPRPDLVLAVSPLTWLPAVGLMGTFLLLLFPDGRLPSPRWKIVARVSAIALVFVPLITTFQASNFADEGFARIRNPLNAESLSPVLDALAASVMLLPLCFIACVSGLVVRFRRSRGVERLQLKWLAAGAGAFALLYLAAMGSSIPFWSRDAAVPFSIALLQEVATFAFVLIPIAAGFAILRYRLYDIEIIINRSLVYGVLSVLVVAVYTAIVLVFERALSERISFGPALLATAVVALAFAPARERVQRRVDRLLYGERRDPYRVVSSLTTRLEASLALDEVMPAVVESVATALRLPWAEVRVHGGVEQARWTHGDKGGVEESFPLHYRGEHVGELAVGPRRGEDQLDPSDRKLLEQLAAQAGAAAHAVSLTHALQQSRQRLVTAREEERRRLRRDLHDGLGPELTGVAMKIDLVRKTLTDDPEQADELLEQLRGRIKAAIDDIRRLVYDLRPPSLDELGLVGALRQQAAQFAGNGHGLSIDIDAPDELPNLSAATEVAAFRIVTEAMTNAARHSGAGSCHVRMALRDGLVVEVTDDGQWKQNRAGVGINSMRERAQELGGSCEVGPAEDGGARVVVVLPIESA